MRATAVVFPAPDEGRGTRGGVPRAGCRRRGDSRARVVDQQWDGGLVSARRAQRWRDAVAERRAVAVSDRGGLPEDRGRGVDRRRCRGPGAWRAGVRHRERGARHVPAARRTRVAGGVRPRPGVEAAAGGGGGRRRGGGGVLGSGVDAGGLQLRHAGGAGAGRDGGGDRGRPGGPLGGADPRLARRRGYPGRPPRRAPGTVSSGRYAAGERRGVAAGSLRRPPLGRLSRGGRHGGVGGGDRRSVAAHGARRRHRVGRILREGGSHRPAVATGRRADAVRGVGLDPAADGPHPWS